MAPTPHAMKFGPEPDAGCAVASPRLRAPGSVPLPIVRVVNWARVALGYGRACALTKTELWEPPFVLPADAVSDWVCGLYPDGDEWPFSRPEVTDYTHDGAKLATSECLVQRSRRGLAVGCPTSGWTRAAIVSTDEVIRQRDDVRVDRFLDALEIDGRVIADPRADFANARNFADGVEIGDRDFLEVDPEIGHPRIGVVAF